jgi:hypothetical protein
MSPPGSRTAAVLWITDHAGWAGCAPSYHLISYGPDKPGCGEDPTAQAQAKKPAQVQDSVINDNGPMIQVVEEKIQLPSDLWRPERPPWPPTGHDPVNAPSHYTSHPSGIECLDVVEHFGFCLGNVIKYVWRADLKGDAIEDLRKARVYLDREIARRERAT